MPPLLLLCRACMLLLVLRAIVPSISATPASAPAAPAPASMHRPCRCLRCCVIWWCRLLVLAGMCTELLLDGDVPIFLICSCPCSSPTAALDRHPSLCLPCCCRLCLFRGFGSSCGPCSGMCCQPLLVLTCQLLL